MAIIASFIVPHPPLIVPEVGKGGEKQIEITSKSYHIIAREIADLNPDTIIISSPHAPFYSDAFFLSNVSSMKGDFSRFLAKDVSFSESIDLELVSKIQECASKRSLVTTENDYSILDHGTMVPLYFIRKYLPDCKIVVVGLSTMPLTVHYQMGLAIQEAVNLCNRRVVYVASGDLSHKLQTYGPYGFVKEGPIYDKRVMEDCSSGSFDKLLEYDEDFLDTVAECGHPSFCMMAGALDGIAVRSKFYSHEDVTGVGYGICSYYPVGKDSNRCFLEDPYVSLAKTTISEYICNQSIPSIDIVSDQDMLSKKAGVFVSIHKFGALRGCIGTFLPVRSSIAEEIIYNAIAASTRDPRFQPITEDELKDLEIHVDVLTPPEDISSPLELDPKKYGVIVTKDSRRGLLLPDLEGVDTVEEQIAIAKSKANILPNEEVLLKRFEVVRHK